MCVCIYIRVHIYIYIYIGVPRVQNGDLPLPLFVYQWLSVKGCGGTSEKTIAKSLKPILGIRE